MIERVAKTEGTLIAERQRAVRRLSGIVEASYRLAGDRTLGSLPDQASHRTWQNIVTYLNEPKPDRYKSFGEIDSHNVGNNVANVYITGEYIRMGLTHKEKGADFYDQMTAWTQDDRKVSEKFVDERYGALRDVVLESAEFSHNGYAYGDQNYNDVWRKTTTTNRRKSFIVALSIADNMFHGMTKDTHHQPHAIDNTQGDIDNLFEYNLPIESAKTEIHAMWDSMMGSIMYHYDPSVDVQERAFVALMEKNFAGIARYEFGERARPDVVGVYVGNRLRTIQNVNPFEASAMRIHGDWVAVQLTNPLRIPGEYDESQVGGRTKVKAGTLSPTLQTVVQRRLDTNVQIDPDAYPADRELDRQEEYIRIYMRQNKISTSEQARMVIGQTAEKPSHEVDSNDIFAQLQVETDPRIGPYSSLSRVDKGNNIIAIASTFESIRRKYLGKLTRFQEVADFLSKSVRHALVNDRGAFDGSYEPLEEQSAEQHAGWAGNAFKRDGISSDRIDQAKLYHDLPHLGQEGINEDWQDEQHYDREATARSHAVLLNTWMLHCQENGISITVDEDIHAVLDDMGLRRSLTSSVVK